MKKLILCSLALIAIASCSPNGSKFGSLSGFLHKPDGTKGSAAAFTVENAYFADSTDYVYLNANLDFPIANNAASKAIRESLFNVLKEQLEKTGYEEDYKISAAVKDSEGANDVLSDLCPKTFTFLSKEAEADFKDRFGDLTEEDFEDKEEFLETIKDAPTWGSDIDLILSYETNSYVVFNSSNYLFYGGAHGGITGAGSLTFDKKSGKLVTDFIQDGKLSEIQPLLIEGFKEYFADLEYGEEEVTEFLNIEDGIIPLPMWTPEPSADGLSFTYQQYEVTAYAFGMPSFTIPYDKIAPFLTPEAKTLLGL